MHVFSLISIRRIIAQKTIHRWKCVKQSGSARHVESNTEIIIMKMKSKRKKKRKELPSKYVSLNHKWIVDTSII